MAKKISFLGIMLALMTVLTTLESFFVAAIPILPPHFKPGLANIVVMYCALAEGRRRAVALNVLKALFVFAIRGPAAGLLSFAGGLLSVLVVIFLSRALAKKRMSYQGVSIFGALAHNFGQYAVVVPMMGLTFPHLLFYFPVLIVSGVVMGFLTGTVLSVLMPVFLQRFNVKK